MRKKGKIPERTIIRFPLYLSILRELEKKGIETVSSRIIAQRAKIKASQFRKDISYFGEFGKQGLGYSVIHLIERITAILYLTRPQQAVLVGAGNLGTALCNFPGFPGWNFEIVRVYDKDPRKVGRRSGKVEVEDVNKLPVDLGIPLGIITVPANAAQKVADLLVKSGIKGILNFSGARLITPPEVIVRDVDLTHELAILNYYCCVKS